MKRMGSEGATRHAVDLRLTSPIGLTVRGLVLECNCRARSLFAYVTQPHTRRNVGFGSDLGSQCRPISRFHVAMADWMLMLLSSGRGVGKIY
jgi:hypothetical protein